MAHGCVRARRPWLRPGRAPGRATVHAQLASLVLAPALAKFHLPDRSRRARHLI